MHRTEVVMGIPMSVDVRDLGDGRSAATALDAAFGVLRSADERFSPYREDSELRRYERGEVPASADLEEILRVAQDASEASGGAFSVQAPDGSLDTNGVVKGWAAERAAGVLRDHGSLRFCLNAGGDVVTAGEPEPGRDWRAGVRDPWDPTRMMAVVELRDGAVATSGTYERGAHVWDGRTGETGAALLSATVVAEDLTTADVLATSVLVLGVEGVAWAVAHGAREAFGVLPDGREVSRAGVAWPGRAP